MGRLHETLLQFGRGFSYVGRQSVLSTLIQVREQYRTRGCVGVRHGSRTLPTHNAHRQRTVRSGILLCQDGGPDVSASPRPEFH